MADPDCQFFLIRMMSRRITWFSLFVLVYALLLSTSWTSIRSILSWYSDASGGDSTVRWPELYASALFGIVFGLLSMAAALAVAIPSMLVTWISILVLLAFTGKPRRSLVLEGRKITSEIAGFTLKIMLKEGNLVAAVCAFLSFVLLVRKED